MTLLNPQEYEAKIQIERNHIATEKLERKRLAEALHALKGVFESMQDDANGIRNANLQEAVTKMEERLVLANDELEELRPLKEENKRVESRNQKTKRQLDQTRCNHSLISSYNLFSYLVTMCNHSHCPFSPLITPSLLFSPRITILFSYYYV